MRRRPLAARCAMASTCQSRPRCADDLQADRHAVARSRPRKRDRGHAGQVERAGEVRHRGVQRIVLVADLRAHLADRPRRRTHGRASAARPPRAAAPRCDRRARGEGAAPSRTRGRQEHAHLQSHAHVLAVSLAALRKAFGVVAPWPPREIVLSRIAAASSMPSMSRAMTSAPSLAAAAVGLVERDAHFHVERILEVAAEARDPHAPRGRGASISAPRQGRAWRRTSRRNRRHCGPSAPRGRARAPRSRTPSRGSAS